MKTLIIIFLSLIGFSLSVCVADDQVRVQAAEITHNTPEGQTVATGNVILERDGHTLAADKVQVDTEKRTYRATGNVELWTPDNTYIKSSEFTSNEDLTEAKIKDIGVLTPSGARFVASEGEVKKGKRTLKHGVYSPCKLCTVGGGLFPLWRIKAEEVEHDTEEERVTYRDVTFDLFGAPVFYVPRYSHSGPESKRESGFLIPDIRIDPTGGGITTPYYYTFAPNSDVTISPTVTTRGQAAVAGEYRHLFHNGRLTVQGEVARFLTVRNGRVKNSASVEAQTNTFGEFQLTDVWFTDFQVQRTTKRNFSAGPGIWYPDRYTTFGHLHGFWDQTSLSFSSYGFQGLRATDGVFNSPTVAPLVEFRYQGLNEFYGGTPHLSAMVSALHRERGGRNTRRLHLEGGWRRPFILTNGVVVDTAVVVRGDFFNTERHVFTPAGAAAPIRFRGSKGRFQPKGAIGVRYPLIRTSKYGFSQIIEPRAQLVLAPTNKNFFSIPNEDSRGFELEEGNFFALNRSPGYDRVSDGSRVDYGFSFDFISPADQSIHGFIGHSVNLSGQAINPSIIGSGLRGRGVSNIIGHLDAVLSDNFTYFGAMRYDPKTHRLRKVYTGANVGNDDIRSQTAFVYYPATPTGVSVVRINQLQQDLAFKFFRYWYIGGGAHYNLRAGAFNTGYVGLHYRDECFSASLKFRRNFGRDVVRDGRWSFMFEFGLKTVSDYDDTSGLPDLFR